MYHPPLQKSRYLLLLILLCFWLPALAQAENCYFSTYRKTFTTNMLKVLTGQTTTYSIPVVPHGDGSVVWDIREDSLYGMPEIIALNHLTADHNACVAKCDYRFSGTYCDQCDTDFYSYDLGCIERINFNEAYFSGTNYFSIYWEVPLSYVTLSTTSSSTLAAATDSSGLEVIEQMATNYAVDCEPLLGATYRTLFGSDSYCRYVDEESDGVTDNLRVYLSNDGEVLNGGSYRTYLFPVTDEKEEIIFEFDGYGSDSVL